MDPTIHLDYARAAGERIAGVAAAGDLKARVPGCPDYDLGSLLVHTGAFCRYARSSVEQRKSPDLDYSDLGDDARAWHAREHARLVEVLAAADHDEVGWSWGRDQRLAFWFRRAAQELTVHRVDAEEAAGVAPHPIDPVLAADGIEELLAEFGRSPNGAGAEGLAEKFGLPGTTLHLHATDLAGRAGEWLVTVGETEFDVRHEHDKGDVAGRGTAADLLLFLWGRAPLERLEVFGDQALLERWTQRATV